MRKFAAICVMGFIVMLNQLELTRFGAPYPVARVNAARAIWLRIVDRASAVQCEDTVEVSGKMDV